MIRSFAIHILNFIFCILCSTTFSQQTNFSQYVDPMIGTGGHGHTFPGATAPFGMVQLSPDTRIDGSWDGCSGYHYSDSAIYGFSHTHLSGTGCSDFGDILIFPSETAIAPATLLDGKILSTFKHENEKAEAGYYSVKLDNGVKAELTSTTRVGLHRYEFPAAEFAYIVLDLELRDKCIGASAVLKDKKIVTGYRQSEAWAKNQVVMYSLEFSQEFVDAYIYAGSVMEQQEPVSGTKVRICFKFKQSPSHSIMVKVGLSPGTIEGAQKNIAAELPHWDFERTKKEAKASWDKELGKIEITESDKDKLSIFYTALYHTMIQPNVAMDVDGMYRGRDDQSHKTEGYTYYSVFSLWDTFRAAHPLYTIIDRKRTLDFIKTFLDQYKYGGRLPVWELASYETDCMIGYHSVSVITDAAAKGIQGFDMNYAFEAMKRSATWNHLGLPAYMDNACITMDDEHESVSKTLEYAYDDWCIAKMATLIGTHKKEDYDTYITRSQYWKNVFDPTTGFMRPKKNGGWLEPFEPREVNNNFTEGNSWQYTFFVPHDVEELKKTMGGPQKFEKKLDELFSAPSQTTGREQADITGLIGQYAHGNEPSHHMAYLYNFVGRSSKTQQRVRQILDEFYKKTPDGLIGNEDCGQMSAWYVLSSLGFYQVAPGSLELAIGSPSYSKALIHLEDGAVFTVVANGLTSTNKYIGSVKLNNRNSEKNFINYSDILGGGSLVFNMTDKLTDWEGTSMPLTTDIPRTKRIVTNPLIKAPFKSFKEKMIIELVSPEAEKKIYYTTDGSEPSLISNLYTQPFSISASTTIKAMSVAKAGGKSAVATGVFNKIVHADWKVNLVSKYNAQYTAGGDEALIDGLKGSTNWRKGDWQGYQYQDFECIIDLGKETELSTFSSNFLQDSRSWIMMPVKVEYSVSSDNKEFKLVATAEHSVKAEDTEIQVKDLVSRLSAKVKARYIKVKAFNFGKLPDWHQGAGGDAFIFIDELEFK